MYEFLMETEQASRILRMLFETFPLQSLAMLLLIFAAGYCTGQGSVKCKEE